MERSEVIKLMVALRAVVLGAACAVIPSGSWAETLAGKSKSSSSTSLRLSCHVSGGGYAIKSATGQVLENGDGMPFPAGPRVLLDITTYPPSIRVAEGTLAHPDCPTGPVLDSVAPLKFSWCQANYDLEARDTGDFLLRSTTSRTIDTAPHRDDIMEAFFVGVCVPTTTPRSRR